MNRHTLAYAAAAVLVSVALTPLVASATAGPSHRVGPMHPTIGGPARSLDTTRALAADGSLNVIVRATDFIVSLDVDPAGWSPGDVFIFKADVYDRTRHQIIGTDAEHCEVGFDTYRCDITVQLTGRGKMEADGWFFGDNVLPVTGGTDDFEGAGGSLHVYRVKHSHDELYSFHLDD